MWSISVIIYAGLEPGGGAARRSSSSQDGDVVPFRDELKRRGQSGYARRRNDPPTILADRAASSVAESLTPTVRALEVCVLPGGKLRHDVTDDRRERSAVPILGLCRGITPAGDVPYDDAKMPLRHGVEFGRRCRTTHYRNSMTAT